MSVNGHLVIIEGNISAGKSTLTKALKENLGYRVFLEATLTNPYLEKFYADPPAYALRMQLWLLRQRYRTYVEAVRHVLETGQGVILDRSVFSDWVFAEKNRIDGTIDKEGFDYYMRLRTQMLESLPIPSVSVYLNVAATTCYERVHNMRQRDCESGIPLDYLTGLGECYDLFVNEMRQKGSQVLEVQWDQFGDADKIAQRIRDIDTSRENLDKQQLSTILRNFQSRMELPHEVYSQWYESEKHTHHDVDAENRAEAAKDKQEMASKENAANAANGVAVC